MTEKTYKGTIKAWNQEKGFGFIDGEQKRDTFIHISGLKKASRLPQVGDTIWYQIDKGKNGKNQAVNAYIRAKSSSSKYSSSHRASKKRTKKNTVGNFLLSMIVLLIIVFFINRSGQFASISLSDIGGNSDNNTSALDIATELANSKQRYTRYSCGGKIHCSQMRSCEEATFYINNCPNTRMDGDGDGVPCEKQWCSY